jgi:hypothetical protein
MAVQAVGVLGCIVGVCYLPNGGSQQAFASLVNLKTGEVTWFNLVQSATGDIRTAAGAEKLVTKLLASMNEDPRERTKG